MLETQDMLYIVLMFCALWFTAFLCWLMYQVVTIIRRAHEVLELVERKIDLLDRSIAGIKSKFDSGTSLFITVADALKRLVDVIRRDRHD
ncbi:hypothetical protein HYS28_01940 [Candidatus Uhrbacteria bacterium]|nr:hypothetical protein [Candidatus Uhrbacteria bacterium]